MHIIDGQKCKSFRGQYWLALLTRLCFATLAKSWKILLPPPPQPNPGSATGEYYLRFGTEKMRKPSFVHPTDKNFLDFMQILPLFWFCPSPPLWGLVPLCTPQTPPPVPSVTALHFIMGCSTNIFCWVWHVKSTTWQKIIKCTILSWF